MNQSRYQRAILLLGCCAIIFASAARAELTSVPQQGMASWYGEAHRGRLMANGQPFDPDKLTAASWFYPLGTKVRVIVNSPGYGNTAPRSVLVTITDRGPARRLVRQGRKIDLAEAAFKQLASPQLGLVEVTIVPEREGQL